MTVLSTASSVAVTKPAGLWSITTTCPKADSTSPSKQIFWVWGSIFFAPSFSHLPSTVTLPAFKMTFTWLRVPMPQSQRNLSNRSIASPFYPVPIKNRL